MPAAEVPKVSGNKIQSWPLVKVTPNNAGHFGSNERAPIEGARVSSVEGGGASRNTKRVARRTPASRSNLASIVSRLKGYCSLKIWYILQSERLFHT